MAASAITYVFSTQTGLQRLHVVKINIKYWLNPRIEWAGRRNCCYHAAKNFQGLIPRRNSPMMPEIEGKESLMQRLFSLGRGFARKVSGLGNAMVCLVSL
jgi:hypothetical protein